ncbi:YbjP/YqhG family protein [Flavobacterium sp. CBA20B-1]|uniref:YbjP/YqhG family protein n=1 Tax=unclassified Flavobacterium TaxID=196869 RepID=UPI0022247C89|nr:MULTISPECIES: YbjP/YqhG family protein [unclassified Flavobacterium]WCM42686.1 YbjP/YqhG family protein [Flavobacterium sp. CBA20B-1]
MNKLYVLMILFSFSFIKCQNKVIEKENATFKKNKIEQDTVHTEKAIQTIKDFYSVFYGSYDVEKNQYLKSKYLSKRILNRIDSLTSNNELILDYDPFIQAQDWDAETLIKTLDIEPLYNKNEYSISFSLFEDKEKTIIHLLLEKDVNGNYLISSILNDRHLNFYDYSIQVQNQMIEKNNNIVSYIPENYILNKENILESPNYRIKIYTHVEEFKTNKKRIFVLEKKVSSSYQRMIVSDNVIPCLKCAGGSGGMDSYSDIKLSDTEISFSKNSIVGDSLSVYSYIFSNTASDFYLTRVILNKSNLYTNENQFKTFNLNEKRISLSNFNVYEENILYNVPLSSETKFTEWDGNYTGNFLRIKEESADPRAYAKIQIVIDKNSAKFHLDSYLEIVNKELIITKMDTNRVFLAEKNNENSKYIITKNDKAFKLKSDLLNKIMADTTIYELEKY